jgi:predicted nuclease with TOPRIM domain
MFSSRPLYCHGMSADGANGEPALRRGRPRKWASEAERKRAYRERKAEDLAAPERLRTELRDARSDIRRLEKDRSRLERKVAQLERQLDREIAARSDQMAESDSKDEAIEFWRASAQTANRQLQEARSGQAISRSQDRWR